MNQMAHAKPHRSPLRVIGLIGLFFAAQCAGAPSEGITPETWTIIQDEIASQPTLVIEEPDKTYNQPINQLIAEERRTHLEIQVTAKSAKTPTNGFQYSSSIPLPYDLQEYIYDQCQEQHVRYTLILALIQRESRFHADATHLNTNGTVDHGLMQLNDTTTQFMNQHGITNLMDPYQNVTGGITLMRYHLNNNGNDEQAALMAYQYGQRGYENKLSQGIASSPEIETLYQYEAQLQTLMRA